MMSMMTSMVMMTKMVMVIDDGNGDGDGDDDDDDDKHGTFATSYFLLRPTDLPLVCSGGSEVLAHVPAHQGRATPERITTCVASTPTHSRTPMTLNKSTYVGVVEELLVVKEEPAAQA